MDDSVVSDSVACEFPAGSLQRVLTYRRRWEAGLQIFNPADRKLVLKSTDVLPVKMNYLRSVPAVICEDPADDE